MPPNVPRKRNLPIEANGDSRTQASSSSKRQRAERPTLFDAVDSISKSKGSREANNAFLQEVEDSEDSDSSDESEIHEFEDVLYKQDKESRKKSLNNHPTQSEDEDSEDTTEFEDVMNISNQGNALTRVTRPDSPSIAAPASLDLTLEDSGAQQVRSLTNPHGTKKSPTKIERQIRINTHCMHVQFLLFHNLIRNGWASDKAVQKELRRQLTPGVQEEIERWRKYCGDAVQPDLKGVPSPTHAAKRRSKEVASYKTDQVQRDWGKHAEQLEETNPNLNRGDPTLRLLKVLSAFWRKTFRVTAPGIRKKGYKDILRLDQEVKAFRKDHNDDSQFGERIQDRAAFHLHAQHLNGSRDIGAQLFTALMRALGIESRLVASLQPIGFGWNKNEDAFAAKKNEGRPIVTSPKLDRKPSERSSPASDPSTGYAESKSNTINGSDSKLSSPLSSDDLDSDPEVGRQAPLQGKRIDKDLPFPAYWTEVLSPISGIWIPVDPLVLNVVAHKPEQLYLFEARGAKAEKSKQVMAYVVAFSADGTAKDVTVRYLKKHVWPGKTKGSRIPIDKIPVYNKAVKVKRYEDYDWFKNVMRAYRKDDARRTSADEVEDANELQPVRTTRDNNDTEKRESLQMYKQHTELVLERFLRRDEALVPKAQHVKLFTVGKGEKAKNEPVFRRKDVVACKTIESWHKEGREVKAGEKPLKMVPVRAVTLLRKREIEEEERETGEKAKQGLYARYQTDWIIPPPIKNGIIPRNAYGNIDVYVPSMVPRGAIHIPLRGSAKICKQLGFNFAEACTGFEFGNKMAVPVIVGVVVAKENEDTVIEAWQAQEVQKQKKEAVKREKTVLGMWKKMYLGLQVIERFKREYGNNAESHMAHAMKEIETKLHSKGPSKRRRDTVKAGKKPNKGNILNGADLDDKEVDSLGDVLGNPRNSDGPGNEGVAEGGFSRNKSHSSSERNEGGFFLGDDDSKLPSPIGDPHRGRKAFKARSTSQVTPDVEDSAPKRTASTGRSRSLRVHEATGNEQNFGTTRTRSRRGAAERSMKAVRSHFFDNDGDESVYNLHSEKR